MFRFYSRIRKVVEALTKGDADRLISLEALEETGAMTREEITPTLDLVRNICLFYEYILVINSVFKNCFMAI